jgi:hypothetical protein
LLDVSFGGVCVLCLRERVRGGKRRRRGGKKRRGGGEEEDDDDERERESARARERERERERERKRDQGAELGLYKPRNLWVSSVYNQAVLCIRKAGRLTGCGRMLMFLTRFQNTHLIIPTCIAPVFLLPLAKLKRGCSVCA